MDALGPLGSGFENLDLLSFEEEPRFEPQVMEKAAKMKQKYDLIHEHFQVPATETIIQDYRCSMLYEGDFSGKIYITQNYVLFLSADQHKQETIPFYKVIAIGKIRTTLVVPAIFIETESAKIIFTGFIHREETYNLLEHLWQYQPNYVQLNENDILRSVKSDFPDNGEGKHKERVEPVEHLGGRWSAMVEEKPTEKDYVKVESAKSTLELAHEIQELNTIALERLQAQAEVIDRTETSLNKTKNKLDEGGRILDGVESVAGQMKNIATPNLYKYRETGAHQVIDRTVTVDVENNVDVPVLIKEANDFLTPGFVRFSEKNFSILDHLLKPLKKQKWGYAQVSKVIIRARHQHLDIRFHNSTDRFRCCTAFIQGLTNELFLRTTSKILLIHEPNTRKFQYGSLAIRERTLRGTRKAEAEEIHGVFEIPKARYSELLSGAPEAVVEKVAERDADLDKIAEALKVIQAGTSAINNETTRQVDQLKDMNKTATDALKTGHNDTFRTKRLG